MKKQIEKFFIITIFLILLNILYAKSEKSDEICIQKTFELYNIVSQETIQFTDDNEYMRGMLVFSGKSINDLGDYHHCMKLKKADFFSVLVYTEKVGVCYFKECEVQTIQKYLPEIIKILETRIPIKLDPSYIFFFDSEFEAQTQIDNHKVGFFIIISIMLVICLMYLLNYLLLNSEKSISKNLTANKIIEKKYESEDNHKRKVSSSNSKSITQKEKKNYKNDDEIDGSSEVFKKPKPTKFTEFDKNEKLEYDNNTEEVEDFKKEKLVKSDKENKIYVKPVDKESKSKKKSIVESILSHFNLKEHLGKILMVKAKPNDPLRIFDGIRFFSCAWVVFGHGFYIFQSLGFYNQLDVVPILVSVWGSIIYSALFAVDVFFYMSAFMFYLGMQKYINKPEEERSVERVNKDYWSNSDYDKLKPNNVVASDFDKNRESEQFNTSEVIDTDEKKQRLINTINTTNISESTVTKIDDDKLISAPAVSDTQIKQSKPPKGKLFIISISIVSRYIRLLPLYLFVIFGVTEIVPIFTSGDMNYMQNSLNSSCLNTWYYNLLYVNNLIKYDATNPMCAGHTWYLANDMQFFLIFIIVFVLLANKHLIRNLVILAIMIASLTVSTILAINWGLNYNDISHNHKPYLQEFDNYYIKPWIRIAPYIVGLFFCEFYLNCKAYPKYKENKDPSEDNIFRKINKSIVNSKTISLITFIIALILINFSVLATWMTNKFVIDMTFQGFMKTFNKVFFCTGLAILVQLTFLDRFKFIYNMLSLGLFNVIGKLTFGIYLIHMYIIFTAGTHFNLLPYLDFGLFSLFAIGAFVSAAFCSLIMSLLFESPVISVLKGLLGKSES